MTSLTAALTGALDCFHNEQADAKLVYGPQRQAVLSLKKAEHAFETITSWPNYQASDLHLLESMAKEANIAQIYYKDESTRFGLKSFKALGGAYAVTRFLQEHLSLLNGKEPSMSDLLSGHYKEQLKDVVVSCATDGNHGRSVAWGAQMFGCQCIIYIHRDVSVGRQSAMEAYAAKVIRITGNYDESVRQAAVDAKKYDRAIISDTSYEGYTKVPANVALGYTVMLSETVTQLNGQIPTHVFIQAGVGGLAAAVCGYFWDLWGDKRPRFVVVEPEAANCLQESAKAGELQVVEGDLDTLMAGLACGEVSHIAWEILDKGADDFITLSEDAVAPCMRALEQHTPSIEAGESAVAGLAACIVGAQNAKWRLALGLDEQSKVLVLGTEGATDPELYQELVFGA
ncbi:diaminopropionate ammonia-lyase [Oceanospirillaceae bacterium]|jgi:diaminopropionate ammonia-lyase|nr:diaminopropionate ammonia-lyase [Oceanospirillaceae bacterium]|tara:strand:+ start:1065 stop:2264 length:1200 start_codon:yes stop_codon:yes gene_type:complete